MATFTRSTVTTNNISSLPDQPAISAAALKAKFDQYGADDKPYINNTLLPELESIADGTSGADRIGATPIVGGIANSVQGILEELDAKVVADAGALATHKTSADHDGRYHTKSEVDALLLANQQGNHLGTWQGYTPSQVDQTLRDEVVNARTSSIYGAFENLKARVDNSDFLFSNLKISTPKDYGAIGDGVEDDTVAFSNAILNNDFVKCDKDKTYKITDTISVPKDKIIFLNGSTIDFQFGSSVKRAFSVEGDNVTICNGSIFVTSSASGGDGSSLSCIHAGSIGDGGGFKNLVFENLTVSTTNVGVGSSIGCTHDCSNVVIRNIYVPSNNKCANIICLEWGGTPENGTGHPHNILIENIYAEKLTLPASDYGFIVWVSSCFNVTMRNIHSEQSFGLIAILSGDNGAMYAPEKYKDSVGTGFVVENVSSESIFGNGIFLVGRGNFFEPSQLPLTTIIKNVKIKCEKTTNPLTFGLYPQYCDGVILQNFEIDGFSVGVVTGNGVRNLKLIDGKVLNSELGGVSFGSSGGACVNPICENVEFIGNNKLGGAGIGTSAVVLNNSKNAKIENCKFGQIGLTETQFFNIGGDNTCFNPRLYNNHTFNIASGGVAYIIGSSGDTQLNAVGTNNTTESGITITSGSPLFKINANGDREFVGASIPTNGTYNQGDKMYYSSPSAAGYIGAVCVTAGTPGTWKNFGAILA